MPNPVPTRKQAIALAVGSLCAVASFAVLAGTTSAFSASPVADTTGTSDTSTAVPAVAPTCPAGTTQTADACERVVVSPAPAPAVVAPAEHAKPAEVTTGVTTEAPPQSLAGAPSPARTPERSGARARYEGEHRDDGATHDPAQEQEPSDG